MLSAALKQLRHGDSFSTQQRKIEEKKKEEGDVLLYLFAQSLNVRVDELSKCFLTADFVLN